MENNNINLQNQDYYPRASRKVIDFILGYFGFFVVALVLYYCAVVFSVVFPFSFLTIPTLLIVIIIALNIKTKRRYIAKGINFAAITLILIPFLFFGACLIAISSYR